jgi:hypothetical protein
MFILIGLIIIFFIISIYIFSGKGAWLIAGYNTMSKEEKAQFDEKKLCHSAGTFLLFVTFLTAILAIVIYYGDKLHSNNIILLAAFVYSALLLIGLFISSRQFKKYSKKG